MPLEFKSLAMMELRRSPGEILDRVAQDGEAFIVERSGQQLGLLVPLSTMLPGIQQRRLSLEFDALEERGEQHRTVFTDDHEVQLEFAHDVDGSEFRIAILLPHGYPSTAPAAFATPIDENSPHRWQDGSLCVFGASEAWNPGKHNAAYVLTLAREWLQHYATWKKSGSWPSGEHSDA